MDKKKKGSKPVIRSYDIDYADEKTLLDTLQEYIHGHETSRPVDTQGYSKLEELGIEEQGFAETGEEFITGLDKAYSREYDEPQLGAAMPSPLGMMRKLAGKTDNLELAKRLRKARKDKELIDTFDAKRLGYLKRGDHEKASKLADRIKKMESDPDYRKAREEFKKRHKSKPGEDWSQSSASQKLPEKDQYDFSPITGGKPVTSENYDAVDEVLSKQFREQKKLGNEKNMHKINQIRQDLWRQLHENEPDLGSRIVENSLIRARIKDAKAAEAARRKAEATPEQEFDTIID
jgi:hypothetical protein